MTEHQRLFLVQAKTDYSVFNLLRKQPELPDCHLLHYLQMATELFGKAWAWKHGPILLSHRAFVGFLRSMTTNRQAQQQLGYKGRNDSWKHIIRKSISLAARIEDLAPAGMVQTQVAAQGWLMSAPEGRRPQIRGWRAGGSLAVASSTPATPLLSPAKIRELNHA